MRITKQKREVLSIIDDSYDHLTAKEIYENARIDMPNISLATVYRILNDLVNTSQIKCITTKEGVNHYDTMKREKHDHFICNSCGCIFDVYNSNVSLDNNTLKDFSISSVDVVLTGICSDCKKGCMENGIKRIKNGS